MLISDLHELIRQHASESVKSRKITQTELARLIGVQQAHISNFLRCRRGLSIEALDAVLNVLDLDVKDLTGRLQHSSPAVIRVPIVHSRAAMSPTIGLDDICSEATFSKVSLGQSSANGARSGWTRLIALKADAAIASPMHPRVEEESVLLIDRYSCTLFSGRKPRLYLIQRNRQLIVRWAELRGTEICLRPERHDVPLEFIPMHREDSSSRCIVGRVLHISTDM